LNDTPIILLHGLLHSREIWSELHFDNNQTVLKPDLPGFGSRAALPRFELFFEHYIEWYDTYIADASHGRPPVIVADSLSAIVILYLLQRKRLKYSHLFLIGCPFEGLPRYLRAINDLIPLGRVLSLYKIMPKSLRYFIIGKANCITLHNKNINLPLLDNCLKNSDVSTVDALIKNLVNPFKMPVESTDDITVVRGEHDKLVSKETSINLSRLLTAQYHEIKNAGHTPMLENPAQLTNLISSVIIRIRESNGI